MSLDSAFAFTVAIAEAATRKTGKGREKRDTWYCTLGRGSHPARRDARLPAAGQRSGNI